MESTDSPIKQIVRANGIPRVCMSSPQGPPLHLLRQAWNQLYCYCASLNCTSLDSLDGFLSDVPMLTLKYRQKEFDILRTQLNTWKHLCLTMVKNPRVKGADNTRDVTAQKGVITRHFHNMAQKKCACWARWNGCLPPLPQRRSVVRPKLPKEKD
jgi:hypothetical protein